MINTIVTDFFGVIANQVNVVDFEKAYNLVHIAPSQNYFDIGDLGDLQLDTIYSNLARDYHVDKKLVADFYYNSAIPHLKYINYLRNIKKKGIKIILLSDTPDHLVEMFIRKFNIEDLFDERYLSYIEKVTKESKEAFINMMNKAKLRIEDFVFVDDRQNNINLAKFLNIDTILYTNEDETISKLKEKFN